MLKLSIAPMIDWSYTHFRVLMKLLAPKALCYTEMQTVHAIQHNPKRALDFHPCELPNLALQVGGSDPKTLADVAKRAENLGFYEINLNLGCPSDRVQKGRFGACLMLEPQRVGDCVQAMKNAVHIPVTAKTRIGVDESDDYDFFHAFIRQLLDSGCDKLIVHARKAWLKGLSPKQNRIIPPLHYDFAYRIKTDFPAIPVIINGNLQRADLEHHLQFVDGVMFGRLACDDPYQMMRIHQALYPDALLRTRAEVLALYLDYLHILPEQYSRSLLIKPLLNLAHGLADNKQWKQKLLQLNSWDDWKHWASLLALLQRLESF